MSIFHPACLRGDCARVRKCFSVSLLHHLFDVTPSEARLFFLGSPSPSSKARRLLLTFDSQEHGVFFLSVAIRCSDNVFSFVIGYTALDFQLVIISIVFLQMFGRLTKFDIITIPRRERERDAACRWRGRRSMETHQETTGGETAMIRQSNSALFPSNT